MHRRTRFRGLLPFLRLLPLSKRTGCLRTERKDTGIAALWQQEGLRHCRGSVSRERDHGTCRWFRRPVSIPFQGLLTRVPGPADLGAGCRIVVENFGDDTLTLVVRARRRWNVGSLDETLSFTRHRSFLAVLLPASASTRPPVFWVGGLRRTAKAVHPLPATSSSAPKIDNNSGSAPERSGA